jgi:phosphoribosyl 1,2-cyclic phosphodiesterase
MKFKFWGTRGSIPIPGEKTIKYGGNTTCIEIITNDDDLIILDAGTGIHALAQDLLQHMPIKAHILITHTHWGHIQGLPFCTPIYIPGNEFIIYGGKDVITNMGIERALQVQLQQAFFPIAENNLKAKVSYKNVVPNEQFVIAGATITPVILNHPVINFGYRVDCDGKSLFFTGDYEQQFNIYEPEDTEYSEFQAMIDLSVDSLVDLIQGVDALIMDSSFTAEEYTQKKGWGHSSYDAAIELAKRANVKQLFLTHHEPTRTDANLDQIYTELLKNYPDLGFELHIAQEKLEITL